MKFYVVSSLLIIFFIRIEDGNGIIMSGGDRVTGNEFNYVASIKIHDNHTCGGAIIDEWHILTAGHCAHPNSTTSMSVLAGSNCLNSDCGLVRRVRKMHLHPGYEMVEEVMANNMTFDYPKNDIAVLTLQTPLILGPEIATVSLPSRNVTFAENETLCRIAGWGATNITSISQSNHLLWMNSSLIEPQTCRNMNNYLLPKFVCSRHPNGTSTILRFDSGSPLVCQGIVVGVVSMSVISNSITISSNVYEFSSFINEAIEENITFKNSYNNTEELQNSGPCVCS